MATINPTAEEILDVVSNAQKFNESEASKDLLSHSGVKGMKWGVWNEETKRKYGIGIRTKAKFTGGNEAANTVLSRAVAKLNKSVAAKKAARASAKEAKARTKSELKAQRKELGMSKKEFDKLRETTLKSHDPRVVAKGMHTLTDEELKNKIRRLQEEDKVTKMATSKEKARHDIAKARNEALNSNPVVSLGKDVASGFLKDSVKELGFNTIVKKGLQPPLEQKAKYYARKAQEKHFKDHPDDLGYEMKDLGLSIPKKSLDGSTSKTNAKSDSKLPKSTSNTKQSKTTVGQFKPVTKYKPNSDDVAKGQRMLKDWDIGKQVNNSVSDKADKLLKKRLG